MFLIILGILIDYVYDFVLGRLSFLALPMYVNIYTDLSVMKTHVKRLLIRISTTHKVLDNLRYCLQEREQVLRICAMYWVVLRRFYLIMDSLILPCFVKRPNFDIYKENVFVIVENDIFNLLQTLTYIFILKLETCATLG